MYLFDPSRTTTVETQHAASPGRQWRAASPGPGFAGMETRMLRLCGGTGIICRRGTRGNKKKRSITAGEAMMLRKRIGRVTDSGDYLLGVGVEPVW